MAYYKPGKTTKHRTGKSVAHGMKGGKKSDSVVHESHKRQNRSHGLPEHAFGPQGEYKGGSASQGGGAPSMASNCAHCD